MDDLAELAGLLQLPPVDEAHWRSSDWSAVEMALGVQLPGDYKAFVDAYGPGAVNDHLLICAPDASVGWTDLVDNNEMAQESCRIWFGGVDDDSSSRLEPAWPLGDSSRWDGDDVPDWFQPGDDLVSWGGTPNGDFLFWHVRPGVAPADHPVVLREHGPYFERFDGGFAMTLKGLLTGAVRSRYLTRWLQAPHSYGFAGRRDSNGRCLE
ncbi:SMI1/KNR4 family protein [Actinoplanes sp. NPDC049802]|uniref:SMI1/KNR4 family protein n=1 Tax=Actinoplanes sp. NPDC049802 TaxID=3154742 RepID=UPI0033D010C8